MKWLIASIVAFLAFLADTTGQCPRDKSRTVRKFLKREFLPIFQDAHLRIPSSCPFQPERDRYVDQEQYKVEETSTRWVCGLCGKAFYEERYLDQHYDQRHQEALRMGPSSICLAGYCDILRCDVISGQRKPQYWDRALCREGDLAQLRKKCQGVMDECLPEIPNSHARNKFQENLHSAICGYMTCNMYWEVPDNEIDSASTALYLIAFMVLGMGVVVYCYVAYTHF